MEMRDRYRKSSRSSSAAENRDPSLLLPWARLPLFSAHPALFIPFSVAASLSSWTSLLYFCPFARFLLPQTTAAYLYPSLHRTGASVYIYSLARPTNQANELATPYKYTKVPGSAQHSFAPWEKYPFPHELLIIFPAHPFLVR